jgi:primosomal protein N'
VTRGAQLLAARPRAETLLVLQTRIPDHVVVQAVVEGDPERVAASEREYRRTLGYPPFGALAELSGEDEPLAAATDQLSGQPVQVFGPTDGRTLVTAPDWDILADALAHAIPKARALGRIRAAVDPPRI